MEASWIAAAAIGNEVGRNADQRNNNRGYYPSNGPRY